MSEPLIDAKAAGALEPWLDKRGLAAHLACSVRSIELAVVDGMPHARIFGRVKFHASEAEAWLEHTGRLERLGKAAIVAVDDRPGSAGTPPGPDHGERMIPRDHQEA